MTRYGGPMIGAAPFERLVVCDACGAEVGVRRSSGDKREHFSRAAGRRCAGSGRPATMDEARRWDGLRRAQAPEGGRGPRLGEGGER